MREIRLCDNGSIENVSKLCRKHDLGIEVQAFYDPYCLEGNPEIKNIHQEMLKDFNKGRSLHAPFWDLNMGTKMHGLAAATIEMFDFAYQRAKEFGCKEVIVHNGYVPNTYGQEAWIARAADRWKTFLSDKLDVVFCIENQFEKSSDMMCSLVDAVDMDNFKMCLDIGHVNAHAEENVLEWIEKSGNRIAYVHLHNNYGVIDEHNGIDKGTMKVFEVTDMLEKHSPEAIWAIETAEEDMETSLLMLKSRYEK